MLNLDGLPIVSISETPGNVCPIFIRHSRTARPITMFECDGDPGPSMHGPWFRPALSRAEPFTTIIGADGAVEITFLFNPICGSTRHSTAAITIGRCRGE